MGPRERPGRRRPDHQDGSAARPGLALSGQSARWAWQSPDGGSRDRRGVQGRRRFEDVSRTDRGRAASMAADEGVHRRRARERGVERAGRRGGIQPLARRFLQQLRRDRPELPAIAEQRPPAIGAWAVVRLLQACGQCDRSAGEGSQLFRWHRHDHRRSVQRPAETGTARRARGARSNRCGGEGCRGRIQAHGAVGGRAGTGARSCGDARRDCATFLRP